MYFDPPDSLEVVPWSNVQAQELLCIHSYNIGMKDTNVAVSKNQMATSVSTNVNLPSTPEKRWLLQIIQEDPQN